MRELDEILKLANLAESEELFEVSDSFDIELSDDFVIESGIVGLLEDGIVISGDDKMLNLLEENGFTITEYEREDTVSKLLGRLDEIAAIGYNNVDEMMIMGNSNEPSESMQIEAEYHGRKVQLGKPFLTPDGPKKRSVYVKKPNGKVVKVNFGDKNMRIKKSNPARRKSFRARHHCENPGPRWKARYWSCRFW